MNPFRKSPSPLKPRNRKDQSRWICPQSAWNKLEEYVENEVNAVIMGVEGSGKSTLLNWFFSDVFCEKAAREKKLIFFADLSDTFSGPELCDHLTKQLKKAAQQYLPVNAQQALEESLAESAQTNRSEKTTFINACESLNTKGLEYTMLLVMDGFERFVSSPHMTQDQHDMLRSLLDRDIMRCVVATNYDLEESSMPEDVAGSLYLQKFQDKIIMRGFSEAEATAFIRTRLNPDDAVKFSDRHISFLQELTGRIPLLYEMAASYIYDELEEKGSIDAKDIRSKVHDAAVTTMRRWCKFFKTEYSQTIEYILTGIKGQTRYTGFSIPMVDDQKTTAAARLNDRGLWRKIQQNEYAFNSVMLQHYFQNGEHLKAQKTAPLAPESPAQPRRVSFPQMPEMNPAPTYIFYGPVNINNNNTYNSVIATRDLLNLLTTAADGRENFAQALYQRMVGALPQHGLLGIEQGADISQDEYDQLYDKAFSEQVSSKVVDSLAVDQDAELVEITEEEQMSLDRRFEEARRVTRPGLTDTMLMKVSSRTAFYLKLSVVVEDALSILRLLRTKDTEVIDCSAQVILYGKAVEQQLKDSFFPLFHKERNLREYQVKTDRFGLAPFRSITEDDTSIGTYMHALRHKATELSQLCVDNRMRYQNQSLSAGQWSAFWMNLQGKINDARRIRNLSAHTNPNDCPVWEDIDQIANVSFDKDTDSIFECCAVATDLSSVIFGRGPLSLFEGKALEGTEAVFCCTKVKTNGGMDGYIEGNRCLAKIGKANAKKYAQQHPEVTLEENGRYRVRLQTYQQLNDTLYFAVELLGPA